MSKEAKIPNPTITPKRHIRHQGKEVSLFMASIKTSPSKRIRFPNNMASP